MSSVDMSSVDIKGPLTCQVLTKIKMSSVDIFFLDEKFLTEINTGIITNSKIRDMSSSLQKSVLAF